MSNITSLFNNLSNEGKAVATVGGISGWFCNLFLLNINPLTWEFLIKGVIGIGMSTGGIVCGLIAKDLYRYYKPKFMKFILPVKIGKRKPGEQRNE